MLKSSLGTPLPSPPSLTMKVHEPSSEMKQKKPDIVGKLEDLSYLHRPHSNLLAGDLKQMFNLDETHWKIAKVIAAE